MRHLIVASTFVKAHFLTHFRVPLVSNRGQKLSTVHLSKNTLRNFKFAQREKFDTVTPLAQITNFEYFRAT